MSITEKIKIIDRQTAKISALSPENVSKYEIWTGKDVLPEKGMLEEAATMERFEYSLLGKALKAQTNIAKKQYQGLGKAFISNKDNKKMNELLIKKEKRKHNKSNLIYNRLDFYSDDKSLADFLLDQTIHIY